MTHATLTGRFRPAAAKARWAYEVLSVLAGSALIALCAQIAVHLPPSPVPVTGQTFAVLLVGAMLGSRRGAMAAGAYLLEGACGLPVFANGACGVQYMLAPTGGYLAGFVAAAWLAGLLAEHGWDRGFGTTAAAMALADAALFLPGVAYLSAFVGPRAALAAGLAPFLPGEAFKIALAAALLPSAWKLVSRAGRP